MDPWLVVLRWSAAGRVRHVLHRHDYFVRLALSPPRPICLHSVLSSQDDPANRQLVSIFFALVMQDV